MLISNNIDWHHCYTGTGEKVAEKRDTGTLKKSYCG